MTNATVNRRLWAVAATLGHGFTLNNKAPDFSLAPSDFDAACAALDAAREDSWPSISNWPRTADGGAKWLTTSSRTRICISGNGDTVIESCTAGFPGTITGSTGGTPDGVITIRGRTTTATGNPSWTAWSCADAIADAEDHVADSADAARLVRAIVDDRSETLARAIETAPAALPRSVIRAGIDAIERHIETNLPSAHRVLLRLRG